ncbi:ribosomal RNA small subunit methyltransferase E [Capnocytophaga stomatis]|uniref:Ribosomal RNA small subunit methyltransferase E n=1 Tax=Capnocytophaga stomatis TaxID=1848904 RepID=A0A250FTE9_9FLAO|nr:16S rRNA (uracil(1498)-N(3))-methyltransferase [Capnocytophaga stomatis]ATA88432.1 16S rRNA (uracil(1498)-N(3))-methyltransferase [Capnocytophaga stomatis]GIJ96160.1 ribosomal RNA small subunit methyltransferase E [Capnocytophaga stomatis]GIM50431.1 ribosomal RNA small subunit methyltransferase E [Capnocytophaga stomatis]
MQLFYYSEIDEQSTSFFFDKEESQHIVKVLRKKQGDLLYVTNGKGWLFETEITFASPKKCEVSILKYEYKSPRPYHLHLVVAPTKMNERYEWFLEKAVEIGVDEITPIICHHSERTVVKTERFEKIIHSAMKQSLQYYLPKLNAPISSMEFFKQLKDDSSAKFIAHCQEGTKYLFSEKLNPFPEKIMVLIGPEGDFSSEEIKAALQNRFQPISLGDNRLRTETAGIVACDFVAICSKLK